MAGEDYFRKYGFATAMEPDFYNRPIQGEVNFKNIEKPIFPIERLGVTVPEVDQSGKARNLIEGVQGAIRRGAGTIQIVMTQPHTSEVGARFKAIGSEVRRAIKEVAQASGAKLQGLELPTSLNNVTGWDGRTGFNEGVRRKNLEEVRDGIKFAADIGSGGGVDVLSWEFPRAVNFVKEINDGAAWQDGKAKDSEVVYYFVDKETGQVKSKISKDEKYSVPFDLPKNPEEAKDMYQYLTHTLKDPAKIEQFEKLIKSRAQSNQSGNTWEFKDVEQFAQQLNKSGIFGKDTASTEEVFLKMDVAKKLQALKTAYAQSLRDAEHYEERERAARNDPDKQKRYGQMVVDLYRTAMSHKQEAEKLEKESLNYERYDQYGQKKAAESYAELAIAAMEESKRHPDQDAIYVGPEIGWPDYYGSHPDEFKQIILDARKKFKELIEKNDEYKDLRPKANELAEKHIKGLFDTSHMGMWFQHYDVKNHDYQDRVEKFNKWYSEKVKELADPKLKLVGDIQLVDTISGAHSHLPAGEGFLPLKETLKTFRDKGFKGDIISEGHEEEKFGDNRIQLSAWKTAGINLGEGYEVNAGRPLSMPMRSTYFGRTYSPLYIVGSYVPSNEIKLWSEVPFE